MDAVQVLARKLQVQTLSELRLPVVHHGSRTATMTPKECDDVDSGTASDDENYSAVAEEDGALPVLTDRRHSTASGDVTVDAFPTTLIFPCCANHLFPSRDAVAESRRLHHRLNPSPSCLCRLQQQHHHQLIVAALFLRDRSSLAPPPPPPRQQRPCADCTGSDDELDRICRRVAESKKRPCMQEDDDDGCSGGVSDGEVSHLLDRVRAATPSSDRTAHLASPYKRTRCDDPDEDAGSVQRPSLDFYKMQRTSLKRKHVTSLHASKPRPLGVRPVVNASTQRRLLRPVPISSRDPSDFHFRSLSWSVPYGIDASESMEDVEPDSR